MKNKCNNYLAVYTNGKVKQKGDYEFEYLPLHKNKSNLITRIAIYEWFVNNTPIEETILNHKNILDFCIGARVKQDAKFFYLDKNGREHNLSKTIRYFISNKGVVIKKRFTDGRTTFMNVAEKKGYTYYQTLLNKYTNTNAHDYDINYRYYIKKTNDELYNIVNHQQSLF